MTKVVTVYAQWSECQREEIQKARVNGGRNYDSPKPLTYAQKRKKSLFETPFRALRGNVRTPSIARWRAHGQLSIRHN